MKLKIKGNKKTIKLPPNLTKSPSLPVLLLVAVLLAVVLFYFYYFLLRDDMLESEIVAPVTSQSDANTQMNATPVVEQADSATVEVRNGTNISGLAKRVVSNLKKDFSDKLTFDPIGTSLVGNYTETYVYVSKENVTEIAKQIADKLNGTAIITLPDGEHATDKDILIILGPNVDN